MAIKKLADDKYKINVYMGAHASRFVQYASTKQEAEIIEAEAKLAKKKGEVKQKNKSYTFEEVYQMWWSNDYTVYRHHEEITLDRTKDLFRLHILPRIGHMQMNKITIDFAEKLQFSWAFGDKKRNISPYSGYKKLVSYTKQVMRYAERKEIVKRNPFELLQLPINAEFKKQAEQRRKEKFYSKETIKQSLHFMRKHYGLQEYTLLALTYSIGAGKGEIYPLIWKDIDFDNMTIQLEHKLIKNKKTGLRTRVLGAKNDYRLRDIPISSELIALLKEWKMEQFRQLQEVGIFQSNEQFLFTYTTQKGLINQPLHPDYLNNKLDRLELKYGLPHIMPHGLRHTYISDLINSDISESIVQSLVGHVEGSNVTRKSYTHYDPEKQKDALRRLNEERRSIGL